MSAYAPHWAAGHFTDVCTLGNHGLSNVLIAARSDQLSSSGAAIELQRFGGGARWCSGCTAVAHVLVATAEQPKPADPGA